jgi:hypothetical protein
MSRCIAWLLPDSFLVVPLFAAARLEVSFRGSSLQVPLVGGVVRRRMLFNAIA